MTSRMVEFLRPRALVAGDRVAVVAPSSRYDEDKLARGAAVLESWGLVPELPSHGEAMRNFAGSDRERARRLTEAFEREDIAAVLTVRGGYGASRLLGRFDPSVARRNPKIFVGYSDITLLLYRLTTEARIFTFHGPMVASDLGRLDAEQLEPFRRFLFGEDGWWKGTGLVTRVPGHATGRLVGGCLSVLMTMIGTPYELDPAGCVLFLEDINEPPYKIDRMLTQLAHAGRLRDVAAVVLGTFSGCDPRDSPGEVLAIFDEILAPLGIPVVSGFDAGHHSTGGLLPIGATVRVRADAGAIDLLEPVLSESGAARRSG